jgi:RHS repeat-associated protein
MLISLVVGTPLAQAAPADPFTGSTPAFDTPAPPSTDYNAGDWGVADQQGAVTYTYPIPVPPGRNGMAPDLALRYSSQGALRGGIAVGWTLSLPSISLDRSKGQQGGVAYQASLGGTSGRLIEVPDANAFPNPVNPVKAYRIEGDSSFIRVFQRELPHHDATEWIALTPDGTQHYFEYVEPIANQADGSRQVATGRASNGATHWYITRQVDPLGNTVQYIWNPEYYEIPDHYRTLAHIEYSANAAAGLAAHAKVEFEYAPLETCPGSEMPIGASNEYNTYRSPNITRIYPVTWYEGVRRLTAIVTSVRDAPGVAWRVSRRITLSYDIEALRCDRNGAPLRYLVQIAAEAFDRTGKGTKIPPLSFAYGATERSFSSPRTLSLSATGYGDYGTIYGAVGTLRDVDGDGILDQMRVAEESGTCTLIWQRGQYGGTIAPEERKVALPTLPWYGGARPSTTPPFNERCTLNGQVTWVAPGDGSSPYHPDVMGQRVLNYQFIDVDGDSLADLVTQIWGWGCRDGGPDYGVLIPPSCGGYATTPQPELLVYRNAGTGFAANPSRITIAHEEGLFRLAAPLPLSEDPWALRWQEYDGYATVRSCGGRGIPSVSDLDGDGYLDLVSAGPWGVTEIPEAEQITYWYVSFGDSSGFPSLRSWPTPPHYSNSRTLADVNGDGLPDLIAGAIDSNGADAPYPWGNEVYFNFGAGFRDTAVPMDGLEAAELLKCAFDEQTTTWVDGQGVYTNGLQVYRTRLLDVDADGLLDIVTFPGSVQEVAAISGVPTVRFNVGDSFLPARALSAPSPAGGSSGAGGSLAARVMQAENGNWRVRADFVDVTGDGFAELVEWSPSGTVTVIESALPRVLTAVTNGQGLRIEYQYAPSTDPQVVAQVAPGLRMAGRRPTWVVTQTTVSAGFDTPAIVTRYTYGQPVYGTQHMGTNRFLGFATTTTMVPAPNGQGEGLRTLRKYDYTLVPTTGDGYLVEELVYEGTFLHRIKTLTWATRPLFANAVKFTHQVTVVSRICDVRESEDNCRNRTERIHYRYEQWMPWQGSGCPAPGPCLYLRTEVHEDSGIRDSSAAVESTDSRITHVLAHEIRYGQSPYRADEYRIQVQEQEHLEGYVDNDAGVASVVYRRVGQVRTTYDQATGLPVKTERWVDANQPPATALRTYDPATGNLLTTQKPNQVGTDKVTRFGYDPHKLFVTDTTNELGHQVQSTYDVATGALLSQTGPNFVRLASVEPVIVAYYQERWTVDGLGRLLEHAVSVDDPAQGYRLVPVTRMTYYDQELPNRVVEMHRRDLDAEVWVTSERTSDGLGRLLTETAMRAAPPHAVTRYSYDAAGNLAAIEEPDPTTDNGATVRYSYAYDGLGRVVRFTRPDDNGTIVIYMGLEKVVQEVADDGSGSTRKGVYDGFGRLVEVQELNGAGAPAITRYSYDSRDNLVQIVDADGNTTQLAHDWAGHRISITRGARTWTYGYDLNGNLVTETAPGAAQATTVYTYDALDRVLTTQFNDLAIQTVPTPAPTSTPSLPPPQPPVTSTVIASELEATPEPPALATPQPAGDHLLYLPVVAQPTLERAGSATVKSAAPAAHDLLYLPVVAQQAGATAAPAPGEGVAVAAAVLAVEGQSLHTIQYVYDEGPNGIGRLSRVTLPHGSVQYTYEARGLVAREQRTATLNDTAQLNVTQSVARTYNALGLPLVSTWDDGQQWRIAYDARALVDAVEWYDPQAKYWVRVAKYERSLSGQPRTQSYLYSGSIYQVRKYSYDVLGRPLQLQDVMNNNATNTVLATFASRAYTYNDTGDLIRIDGATGGHSAAASYTYDAQHRLLAAAGPKGYAGTFTYSPAGNLLTANVSWTGSSETRNVRYEYGGRDPQAVDRLVNVANDSAYADFTYDLSGNMTQRRTPAGTWSLSWDGMDRLRMAEGPNGQEVYYYDQNGNRMLAVSQSEGVRFWFAESETQYTLQGAQTRRYLHLSDGGSTIARVENKTQLELQYADALQNLMFTLDRTGHWVAKFLYGSFGEVVYAEGAANHRRQFNGKENDALTGLRYYGFRYYDPLALRWTGADPLFRFAPEFGLTEPQRLNLYSFSLNNPVRYYDPDGRAADAPADTYEEETVCYEMELACYPEEEQAPEAEERAGSDIADEAYELTIDLLEYGTGEMANRTLYSTLHKEIDALGMNWVPEAWSTADGAALPWNVGSKALGVAGMLLDAKGFSDSVNQMVTSKDSVEQSRAGLDAGWNLVGFGVGFASLAGVITSPAWGPVVGVGALTNAGTQALDRATGGALSDQMAGIKNSGHWEPAGSDLSSIFDFMREREYMRQRGLGRR